MRRWLPRMLPAVLVFVTVGFVGVQLLGDDTVDEQGSTPLSVEASGLRFGSLDEMAAASDLVVVGTIVGTSEGRAITDPADPGTGLVTRLFELEVDEVLTGSAVDFVLVEQEHALLDGTAIEVNGLSSHEVGQAGLWFLVVGATPEFPYSALVNEQGRLLLVDDDQFEFGTLAGDSTLDAVRDKFVGG